MAKQKNLALNKMFPVTSAPTTTDAALAHAFPEMKAEETLKSVVQDIGRSYGSIPVETIVPNPFQPRKKFDQQKLQELADSLKEEGMLEPILVRVSPTTDGVYEIAAGERRWRAAKLAGWTHCPAEIMAACPDARMKRIALLENLQREQLTPLELAETYEMLMQERDEQEKPVYTVRSLADMLKKDKGHVDDHRALLRVPSDARQLIEEDPDIPVRVIRELGNVEDPIDRTYLIEEVRARNLKTADIIAILQQRKKRQHGPPSTSTLTPGYPAQAKAQEQQNTTTVIEHERTGGKPSPALAAVVLERKLEKDQAQLQKALHRIMSELPSMSTEEKALVRTYIEQWRDTIQRLADQL